MPDTLHTAESLRDHYEPAIERARLKTLTRLDAHCRRFIELSPFLCLGTSAEGGADVTPRGDQPGFVHILDDNTIAIPDWRGNNRLDSLTNVAANPQVGLLFLIPGVTETLRVNGDAVISVDRRLLDRWEVNGKHPASALVVTVREAYVHCGKALIRSKLWDEQSKIDRAALPTYGQMLKDHTRIADSAEEIERSVQDAYNTRLY